MWQSTCFESCSMLSDVIPKIPHFGTKVVELCLYVCMYVWCIHVCVCAYVCVYVCVCVRASTLLEWVDGRKATDHIIHMITPHINNHIRTVNSTHTHITHTWHTHTHTHIHTHTHTHTNTHTDTHTHTHSDLFRRCGRVNDLQFERKIVLNGVQFR